MIINCNNRDTRQSIYLNDGLLHQISVIDCVLMRLRLNRLSFWRDNLKLRTNYRLRIISAFQNSYAFNYWYLERVEIAAKTLLDFTATAHTYLIFTIYYTHYIWSYSFIKYIKSHRELCHIKF